jgi:2-polyprenyl-3-methyl-5-hydroxy-6-metoxy-1,4-benzoquinol methylase
MARPDFEKNKEMYAKLARQHANKTVIAGRYAFDEGKEQYIVNDILAKLDIKNNSSFFDIGCGAGLVAELLIKKLYELDISITVMDADEIIDILINDFISKTELPGIKINPLKGYFPEEFSLTQQKFDRILLYAVLVGIARPFEIVKAAVSLLKPYGKLLIGDLPNISQKGRFLSSEKGRNFDSAYKNTKIEDLPLYNDHHDFVAKMKADPGYYSLITDDFIHKVHQTFTRNGFDVFILPQPDSLPFSKTRHDILICKYD